MGAGAIIVIKITGQRRGSLSLTGFGKDAEIIGAQVYYI
mgnify:CR=1 FL=1